MVAVDREPEAVAAASAAAEGVVNLSVAVGDGEDTGILPGRTRPVLFVPLFFAFGRRPAGCWAGIGVVRHGSLAALVWSFEARRRGRPVPGAQLRTKVIFLAPSVHS